MDWFLYDNSLRHERVKVDSMVASPGQFQIMFLVSKTDSSKITFAIENKQIKCKGEVKLLGITIDEKLIFTKIIANICSLATTDEEL